MDYQRAQSPFEPIDSDAHVEQTNEWHFPFTSMEGKMPPALQDSAEVLRRSGFFWRVGGEKSRLQALWTCLVEFLIAIQLLSVCCDFSDLGLFRPGNRQKALYIYSYDSLYVMSCLFSLLKVTDCLVTQSLLFLLINFKLNWESVMSFWIDHRISSCLAFCLSSPPLPPEGLQIPELFLSLQAMRSQVIWRKVLSRKRANQKTLEHHQ